MYLEQEEGLLRRFEDVLRDKAPDGRQKEQVVQDFLEENSELIPLPNLLNHGLHFEFIISKFPLSTALTTDYVYITKSSDRWRITFVELEVPEKAFFNETFDRAAASAKFNGALDQVRSWETFVTKNQEEVLRRLRPLMQPETMWRNPVEFNYQLIIGRSDNKNATTERMEYIQRLRDKERIEVMSYDSLINWYKSGPRFKKNVLRVKGDRFFLESMQTSPGIMFAWLGRDALELPSKYVDQLRAEGYEMDAWLAGKTLRYNGKWTSSDRFSESIRAAIDGQKK